MDANEHRQHGYPPYSGVGAFEVLRLISTIELPRSPEGHHENNPSEPRILPDGSIYVSTFNCGLYHVHGIAGMRPSAHFVFAFPGGDSSETLCGIPVVVGNFWIQTVAALPGFIVLNVRDPEHPVEVSRLVLDKKFQRPHWIAADRKGSRLVATGAMQSWILIVNIDLRSGTLRVDEKFREKRADIPSLAVEGKAVLHGALFGPQ